MDARSEYLLMATVAVVDGELNWQEHAILEAYATHIGLPEEDAREVLERLTKGRRVGAVSPKEADAQKVVYQRLVEAAMVDGKLLRSEFNLLKKLGPAYQVKTDQLKLLLAQAKRWLGANPELPPRPAARFAVSPGGVALSAVGLALALAAGLVFGLAALAWWIPAVGGGLGLVLLGLGLWLWGRGRRLHRLGVPTVGVVRRDGDRARYRYYHAGEGYEGPLRPTERGLPEAGCGVWVLVDPQAPGHSLHWWRPAPSGKDDGEEG